MLNGELTPGEWEQAICAWAFVLRAAARRPKTIKLRVYQLERLQAAMTLRGLGPWEVTSDHLVEWTGSQSWGVNSRRSYRSALRSFYGWAHGTERMRVNPALALKPIKPKPPQPRPTPEPAVRVARSVGDERVRLMVRMASEVGMRRGEVAISHTRDLEPDLDGWTLVVHGKGGKDRRVPLDEGFAAMLRAVAPAGGGYFFPGRIEGHLSEAWVGKIVARALPDRYAMHSLRHRFGTVAYRHRRDLRVVQELMGHASPVTTAGYVLVEADELRATMRAVARAG